MFSRPCDQFSGRSQRPGGRRRQDPATRTPSYPGRPACTLRSDPGARRRPASFGDRPEIPGAESMFSRLCGRFSGRLDRPDRPRRQGPSKRTPLDPGRRGSALRGGPRPRRQAVRFGDRLGKIPGADSMFSRACGRFSGRSQQPGGHRRQDPARRTPSPQGRPAWASRGDARPRRRHARFGHPPGGIPGAESMFSRPCSRFCGRPQRPDGHRSHDPSKRTPSSQGCPASALRGDVRPGRRPARFGDRAGEIPGADSMFSKTCGRFSGRPQRPRRVTELNLSGPAPSLRAPSGVERRPSFDGLWRHDDSGERRAPWFPLIAASPFRLPATTDQGRQALELRRFVVSSFAFLKVVMPADAGALGRGAASRKRDWTPGPRRRVPGRPAMTAATVPIVLPPFIALAGPMRASEIALAGSSALPT